MGVIPSRETTTLFSYFRGTYEIGLIPLTSHFFGRDEVGPGEECGDPTASSGSDGSPSAVTANGGAFTFSRAELRAQLIEARDDPAMRYAISRDKASILKAMEKARLGQENPSESVEDTWMRDYWSTMPESNFDEDDLDRYLAVVDKYLYKTDIDMVNDPRYAGSGPDLSAEALAAAAALSATHVEVSSRELPPLFVPIPCALCLTYQDGKRGADSFLLNGRHAKIIGFFGVFTAEMEQAFKVVKFVKKEAKDSESAREGQATKAAAHRTCPWLEANEGRELAMHSAILSSAGDRTLERVLILASVVLRQLFHGACWRDRTEKTGASHAHEHEAQGVAPSTPFLARPLPPAAHGCFTLNMAADFAEGETAPLDIKAVEAVLLRPSSFPDNAAQLGPEQVTAATESSFDWALYRRLAQLAVCASTAGNDYTSLKSLAENLAFLHSQVILDSADSYLEVIDMPCPRPAVSARADAAAAETSATETSHSRDDSPPGERSSGAAPTEVPAASASSDGHRPAAAGEARTLWENATDLLPTSAIIIHFSPRYFAQGSVWAGSLFHAPALICEQRWVQYKLKDECEQLRGVIQKKDTLIAGWRRRDPVRASHYIGPETPDFLRYISFLQVETEEARNRPLHRWEGTIFSSHGRRYAMHRGPCGAMLVGVRGSKVPASTSVIPAAATVVKSESANNGPRRRADAKPPTPPGAQGTAERDTTTRRGNGANSTNNTNHNTHTGGAAERSSGTAKSAAAEKREMGGTPALPGQHPFTLGVPMTGGAPAQRYSEARAGQALPDGVSWAQGGVPFLPSPPGGGVYAAGAVMMPAPCVIQGSPMWLSYAPPPFSFMAPNMPSPSQPVQQQQQQQHQHQQQQHQHQQQQHQHQQQQPTQQQQQQVQPMILYVPVQSTSAPMPNSHSMPTGMTAANGLPTYALPTNQTTQSASSLPSYAVFDANPSGVPTQQADAPNRTSAEPVQYVMFTDQETMKRAVQQQLQQRRWPPYTPVYPPTESPQPQIYFLESNGLPAAQPSPAHHAASPPVDSGRPSLSTVAASSTQPIWILPSHIQENTSGAQRAPATQPADSRAQTGVPFSTPYPRTDVAAILPAFLYPQQPAS